MNDLYSSHYKYKKENKEQNKYLHINSYKNNIFTLRLIGTYSWNITTVKAILGGKQIKEEQLVSYYTACDDKPFILKNIESIIKRIDPDY